MTECAYAHHPKFLGGAGMNRRIFLKPLSVAVLLALMTGTAFAETDHSVSDTINTRKDLPPISENSGNVAVNPDMPQSVSINGSLPPAAMQNQSIAPYVGQTVTKISVTGNQKIPTDDIIYAVKTKPGMKLSEESVMNDLQSIYELGWFYDLAPVFTQVPEGVQLTYHVMENPVFQRVHVTGNEKMVTDKVEALLDLPQDQIINIKQVNAKVQDLESAYNASGYILARVSDLRMDADGILNVAINEGIVEGYKVKGNVKTKDYVLTREMKCKVGEPFNSKDARRSMQRIYNLGYFEDVNLKLNPGVNPNGVEIEIDVVEANTGNFGIGAGYSDADGFIGMISIGDKNFRGTGDSINFRWEFGGEDPVNYDVTYTKPWLDDHETTLNLEFYNLTGEYADYDRDANEIARYDKKRVGQEVTLSRKTDNEFISNYVMLKNRKDSYDEYQDGYDNQYYEDSFTDAKNGPTNWKKYPWMKKTAAERREENFGTTRSITIGRIFDSRDNKYDPHMGKRTLYSVEYAGLGGDFDFTKYSVDLRYYYAQGPKNVIAVNLAAGYASGDMPLSQRFSVGGSDTLRGYEDDQFRGNSMLRGTVEYRMPVVDKVQAVVFADYGYAWDKRYEDDFDFGEMKLGYGIGVRVNSPLGPIKLDYGIGEDDNHFHFSFGGSF